MEMGSCLGLVEEAFNAVLHRLDLGRELRALVLDDGAGDDGARHSAGASEGLLAGDVHVGHVLHASREEEEEERKSRSGTALFFFFF